MDKVDAVRRIMLTMSRQILRMEHDHRRNIQDHVLVALMKLREDTKDDERGAAFSLEAVAKIMREDFSQPYDQRTIYSYHKAAVKRLRTSRPKLESTLSSMEKLFDERDDMGQEPLQRE